MDKEFFISTVLNGSKHEIDEAELNMLDIIQTGENQYHIISDNKNYKIDLIEACYESKQFNIKVNGKSFTLGLEDEFDIKISKLGFSNQETKSIKELKAPMPGMVLQIFVEKGNEVKQEEQLIILEAMKMENIIKSPVDGTIESVEVDLNQAVNKNAVLLKFE
jgi:biotin carboxyl carrier protein